MTREQREIQDTEIRGITPKIIAWIIGSTVSIIMSIAGGVWVLSAWGAHMNDRVNAVEEKTNTNTININSLFLRANAHDIELQKLKDQKN